MKVKGGEGKEEEGMGRGRGGRGRLGKGGDRREGKGRDLKSSQVKILLSGCDKQSLSCTAQPPTVSWTTTMQIPVVVYVR